MLTISRALAATALLLAFACGRDARAQDAPAPDAQAPAPAPAPAPEPEPAPEPARTAPHSIPADTAVVLETAQPLSSATLKRGDAIALRLAEPLAVDGAIAVPAGAACHGEVIHAERARGGGKAGELLLAARYIEHQGRRIPLRGFRISASGDQKIGAAVGVALVGGPLAMFVRGGQIELPAGTRAQARVAQAVDLAAPAPPEQASPPAVAPAPAPVSTNHPTTGKAVQ